MISTHTVEALISFLVLAIAYAAIGSLAGYFQTFMATKMGDDTAEREGFLTLNPLMHIDPIGMFFLLYFGVGWTQHIPINPYNLRSPARLAWAYLSQVCVYLAVAFVALVQLELIFGSKVPMVMSYTSALTVFNAVYPQAHSAILVIGLLLVTCIYLSVLLAVLDIIFVGTRVLFHIYLPEAAENQLILFLVSFLAIIFFGDALKFYILVGIQSASTAVAHLFGAV